MKTAKENGSIPDDRLVFPWSSDANGHRIFIDGAWSEFTGRTNDPAIAERQEFSSWKRDVHPDDLPIVEQQLEFHLISKQPYLIEYRIVRHDGKWNWITEVGSPRFADTHRFSGYDGQCFVINESRRSRVAAAEESQKQIQFLAILSHELRNPLTAIMQSIDVGNKSNEVPAGLSRIWEIIERQTTHLSKLLNDLLDVSRLTRNRIVFDKQRVDLREIVKEDFDATHALPLNTQLELKMIETADPIFVIGDDSRIRQAVTNLMDNAVKYTPAGGSVTVMLESDDDHAVVSVSDTGKGIRKANLDKIFELFFQETQSGNRAGGGMGVGLYLVKQIVNEHGGTIKAISEGPGLGTMVVLSLPLAPQQSD